MNERLDLSPGLERVGRAAACIWHEAVILMVAAEGLDNIGRWTLPGGGIEPGETAPQAAVREAWEERGAHIEVTAEGFEVWSPHSGAPSTVFLARLLSLEDSPEQRPRRWVDPFESPWADDYQQEAAVNVMRERGWL